MRWTVSEIDPNDERKIYLDERKLLIEAERESARSFDKTIITLSAGALGFSLTFIRQIAPNPQPDTLWLLVGAWVSFALALLAILLSFLLSQSAIRRQRKIIDEEQESKKAAREQPNCWATVTNWLNWISMGLFVIGVVSLTFFSYNNFASHVEEARMSNSAHESEEGVSKQAVRLQEGFVPPKPPAKKVEPPTPRKPDAQKPE